MVERLLLLKTLGFLSLLSICSVRRDDAPGTRVLMRMPTARQEGEAQRGKRGARCGKEFGHPAQSAALRGKGEKGYI